ncbi:MAG: HAMP domain-containing protein [Chitinivibrionales bacterium]|nr:HAMP domain-containing protein [Chitinivibrionales bacterium]
MRRKQLFWHIYPSYLIITFLALAFITLYAATTFRSFHLNQTEMDLKARALLVQDEITEYVKNDAYAEIDSFCVAKGKKSRTRITVILPSGLVVGDSERDPETMDNHANRPEIITAFGGHKGMAIRFSATLQRNLMYVALPIYINNNIKAVLRTSLPVEFITKALHATFFGVFLASVMIVIIIGLISVVISRRFSRPVEELKQGAERFASGELKQKLAVPNTDELGKLAEAMNTMAIQLDERITTITRQHSEKEAILSCMVEGVIAVTHDEYVISLNEAAASMLDIDRDNITGRLIQEAIRNSDIQRFVKSALQLEQMQNIEEEIVLMSSDKKEMFIQLHGTVLHGNKENTIGALVVLNDVTRMKRLENIRKDFVANVSHELRTPLTSIHGFVETLLGGGVDNDKDRMRFLHIIATQVDRLNSIIQDLLILSKIEKDDEKQGLELEETHLTPVIKEAILVCQKKADDKKITINLDCGNSISALINPFLIEQAIINLIDNAIKYSEEGKDITVKAIADKEEVRIAVEDQGHGIDRKHLDRLFERFYRVDKARSRKLGGTGLGLAIVKHIILAHKGNVSVESNIGKGSIFSLHLAKAANNTAS